MTRERTRRRLLAALGSTGAVALAGCSQSEDADTAATSAVTASTTATAATTTRTVTDTATSEPAAPELASASLAADRVGQFQPVDLEYAVANAGGDAFEGHAVVTVDGERVHSAGVTVDGGEELSRTVTVRVGVRGDHDVAVAAYGDGESDPFATERTSLAVETYPGSFVGVDGTTFTCGDGTLYCNGANDQQVMATQIPRERIDRVFALADDLGMNVMRVFGFAPAWSAEAAQPAPSEYNERFFERLDRVVAAAKRHGIRLVVPLVGNAPGPDSVPQYVEWVDGATEHNDFYEHERCRDLYKGYVEHVLTRTNPLTGLEYREDPTIMLWELGNELNCRWPKKYPLDWIREMGAFVKDLDDEHLLSTGIRGNQWGADPNDKESYKDGITRETTVIRDHDPDVIDAASVHFYPKTYDIEDDRLLRDFVTSVHDTLDKPVYIGEFNWQVDPDEGGSLDARNEHLETWYEVFAEESVNAAFVHEISTPDVAAVKEGTRGAYSILPEEDERTAELLRSHSRWVREHSTSECPGARPEDGA
ncbi:cellulase family glycosylhydrolase [Halorubellus sp. PRR65]|uniref:glycoside hydrolase 5 family protein n=1 Tax=Halorubellus sp. PRR65 TaxID=3098148 RepID=UPI002B25AA90|nr:cellulase family glycosylhydrolase [Halorubellus sp. PRR65]